MNRMGCVQVRTNVYSVPAARYDGGGPRTPEPRGSPQGRQCVARHERCYGRQRQVLELEHYLDVLARKPGALVGSKQLAVWREKGLWPDSLTGEWRR